MDMRQMTEAGRKIEDDSFSIIDLEVGEHHFNPQEWEVVRRVIHSTADFEFKQLMQFHAEAISSGIKALLHGKPIVADVEMILAGINKQRLAKYGIKTYQFISDLDVIERAKELNTTRAEQAMRKAHHLGLIDGGVVCVGNAPTALLTLIDLMEKENVRPALIVGTPVGFVSADTSKDKIIDYGKAPYIVARGRKGGSTIVVAIIHALLLLSEKQV